MKRKVFLFQGCLLFCFISKAQNLNQNVIASAGGVDKTSKISFEWTLGEFSVETITTAKNLYTQGFHQPILMVKNFHSPKLESSNDILSSYKVIIAPNPVQSFINVYISSKENEKFSLTLYDMNGRKIMTKLAAGKDLSVRVEMAHFSSGIYLIDVRNDTGTLMRSFKIVKAG